MSGYVIEKHARSPAAPPAVYRLLRDGSTWPDWARISSFELERHGAGEPEGLGAIRVFTSGRVRGRDEITGFIADRRFSYAHLGGLPVRNYRATIDLAPSGDGTEITWRVTFEPKYPGTGRLLRRLLDRFVARNVEGLAKHAVSG